MNGCSEPVLSPVIVLESRLIKEVPRHSFGERTGQDVREG